MNQFLRQEIVDLCENNTVNNVSTNYELVMQKKTYIFLIHLIGNDFLIYKSGGFIITTIWYFPSLHNIELEPFQCSTKYFIFRYKQR